MLTNIKVTQAPLETISIGDKARLFEAEMMSLAWTRCERRPTPSLCGNSEIRFSLEGCYERNFILEGNHYFFTVSRIEGREFSEKVLILTFDDHRFYWANASYDHCLGHFMSGGVAAQRLVVQELDYMETITLDNLVNRHKESLESGPAFQDCYYAVSFPADGKTKCINILRRDMSMSLSDAAFLVLRGKCSLPGLTPQAADELRALGASIRDRKI